MLSKGVVIYGKEDFRYEDFEIKDPGPEEVLVEIESCGVCAADPKIYYGKAYFSPTVYQNAPIVAGHEFMGRVIKLGDGAAEKYGLKIGDRAIAEQIPPCWECWWCRRGEYNLCDRHYTYGVKGANGGWAEHMIYTKDSIVHKVPDSLSLKDAAVIEPAACALHGVNLAEINFGETVVVIGCGPIGMFMVQGAKLKNPKDLIVVDTDDERLEIAKKYGATLTINPLKEDAAEKVIALTGEKYGCDVVLEVAGNNASVNSAIKMLRRGGRLMEFSVFAEEVSFDWSIISDIKELTIRGGHLGYRTYDPVIDLFAKGLMSSEGIASTPYKLADFKQAINDSMNHKSDGMKTLMVP